jgi:hypothetical protein
VRADAEGLTAQRVRIVGTLLVSTDDNAVRSHVISTTNEDLPPAPGRNSYRDDETLFEFSPEADQFPHLHALHGQRVIATGTIYFFPSDDSQSASTIFMPDDIQEYGGDSEKHIRSPGH